MKVEYWIDKWIFHAKNKGYDQRQGVANGAVVAKILKLSFGEAIIAPVTSLDVIPDGLGSFCIMMKPINRWIVMEGEFVDSKSSPIYKKNFWGKRKFVGREDEIVPVGGKILKLKTVRFYSYKSFTGTNKHSYTLINSTWTKTS